MRRESRPLLHVFKALCTQGGVGGWHTHAHFGCLHSLSLTLWHCIDWNGQFSARQSVNVTDTAMSEAGRTDGRTKAPSFPPPVCPSVVRASFFLALFAANDEFSFQRACNWLQEGRRTPPRHIYSPLLRTIYWHNLSQKHVLA